MVHVATYVSEDGAFGGPISVAVAQCRELARRGHEVYFLAGSDGRTHLDIEGVQVELFNVRRIAPGFSGLTSISMLRRIRELAGPGTTFHIHLSRDLITLPAAILTRRREAPTFLQTHGMIMPDHRLRARILDKLATRTTLGRAKNVFSLTDDERIGLLQVAGHRSTISISAIANGFSPVTLFHPRRRKEKEVLFLARLERRKGVIRFAESARRISKIRPDVSFRVVGPDEGDLRPLQEFISSNNLQHVITYEGAISPGDAPARLAGSGVYVLPSHGEVFPMTVLEAFAAQTPVVLSSDCGLAPLLHNQQAALVVDLEPDPQKLVDAILLLLDDHDARARTVANASALLMSDLSITSVVDRLESSYKAVNDAA